MLKFPRSSPGLATLDEHPYLEGLAGGCSKTIPTKGGSHEVPTTGHPRIAHSQGIYT
jgi:hypothetical protein